MTSTKASKETFLSVMRNHENLNKLATDSLKDELIEECSSIIDNYKYDYLEYGEDPCFEILADKSGERFEIFRDDNSWRRREYLKMCHWRYVYSFRLSEIYED